MKNTERASLDLHVALSPSGRPAASQPAQEVQGHADADRAEGAVAEGGQARARPGFKTVLKRKARPVAAAAYRLLRPVLRPIAFRVRAYLTEPIRLEIQRSQVMAQEALFQSSARLEASVDRLLAAHTLQVVQEVQAARDSLRRRIASSGAAEADFAARIARIEQFSHAAAARIAIPCGPGEILVRTAVGYVLCSATDHALLSSLIEAGELEPGTRTLIQRLLKPGDTFIDVGANIGMLTLAAAVAMGGKGRIVAFEPFAPTHALLCKTIWMNGYAGLVETHQAAVSDHNGSQTLYLGATSGHHSLYQLQDAILPAPAPVEVALVRIDDVLHDAARIDLIKIDVEGAELEVLEGASLAIANNKDVALVVEFGFSHIQRSGHSTEDWLQAFERFGLEFGVIDANTGKLEKWTKQQLESSGTVNLFFARRESPAWKRAWEMQ